MRARTWIIGVAALSTCVLTAAALAAGGPGMMGPEHRTSVPSFLGYYDGHKDTFLGPDSSSRSEANMEHINFSAKLGASVKTAEEIYLFSGKTITGQLPVFSSEPGEKTYTPLWREEIITWKPGVTPTLITSDTGVDDLKKKGMITVRETSTVLNCPIVKVGKGGSS
jgi:hypothetical protein